MAMTLSSKAAQPIDTPKRITVLGSTGSIGCSTLDLVARAPERFRVCALTAWNNVDTLIQQARQFRPEVVVIGDEDKFGVLKSALGDSGIELAAGADALVSAAKIEVDWIMAAIVGAAGLEPTLAAVRQGAVVALAKLVPERYVLILGLVYEVFLCWLVSVGMTRSTVVMFDHVPLVTWTELIIVLFPLLVPSSARLNVSL